jgi:hypothetical protein
MMPKIFLIGFNKCATRSFTEFFRRNGLKSCHWKIPGEEQTIAEKIVSNISLAKAPLSGLDKFTVFSDITCLRKEIYIDIPLILPFLINAYQFSYFIFQYRSIDKWIESRLKHASFLRRSSQVLGNASKSEVIDCWKQQYYAHSDYVRRTVPARCKYMEFELEAEPIDELIKFLSNDYSLNASCWPHKGKTELN